MCGVRTPKFSGRAESRVGIDGNGERGDVRVRKFRVEDIEAVLAISAESQEAANWSRESYKKLVVEVSASAFVVEAQGKISGFLVGRRVEDQAEVLNMAVRADHRRNGEGFALLSAALDEFGLRGVKNVYLEVRESNTRAISFYEKHGFLKSGLRKGYYRSPDEAAVTMERKLTVPPG